MLSVFPDTNSPNNGKAFSSSLVSQNKIHLWLLEQIYINWNLLFMAFPSDILHNMAENIKVFKNFQGFILLC